MKKLSFVKTVQAVFLAIFMIAGITAAFNATPYAQEAQTISKIIAVSFGLAWLAYTVISSAFGVGRYGLGADNLNIEDTSWSGPALEYMITRAVTDADTIIKGVACVLEEISRKAITIPRLEVSVLMQAYTPSPTALGDTTVDGRVLPLQKFEFYDEFNPQDYEVHFFEQDYDETRLIDEVLPATAENYTMLQYMKRLNKWFEDSFWNGRLMWNPAGPNINPTAKGYADDSLQTGTDYFFDGLLYEMLSDSTVQTFAFNPANWTAANIGPVQFSGMYKQLINNPISKALAYKYGPTGLRYLISYADQATYEDGLITAQFKSIDTTQSGINRYRGYELVPLAGLDQYTAALSIARPDYASNFYIGTNSTEDVMLEMKKKNAYEDLWFVKGIFKMATIHGYGDQVVLSTPVVK